MTPTDDFTPEQLKQIYDRLNNPQQPEPAPRHSTPQTNCWNSWPAFRATRRSKLEPGAEGVTMRCCTQPRRYSRLRTNSGHLHRTGTGCAYESTKASFRRAPPSNTAKF